MSKYIDCTMPFYDYMPVGNVWAWDVPFRTEPITTHEKNSYELWMITMHSETGTRLMIKAMQDPNAPTGCPMRHGRRRDSRTGPQCGGECRYQERGYIHPEDRLG